jgi:hypothetical protein
MFHLGALFRRERSQEFGTDLLHVGKALRHRLALSMRPQARGDMLRRARRFDESRWSVVVGRWQERIAREFDFFQFILVVRGDRNPSLSG